MTAEELLLHSSGEVFVYVANCLVLQCCTACSKHRAFDAINVQD